jgi:hypothetical protein
MAKNTSSNLSKKSRESDLVVKKSAKGTGKKKASTRTPTAKTSKLVKNLSATKVIEDPQSKPSKTRVNSTVGSLTKTPKLENKSTRRDGKDEKVAKTLKMVKTGNNLSRAAEVQTNGVLESLKVMPTVKAGFPLLFTNKRKAYIEGYIRELLIIMRLQDWTITMDWSISKDQDVYATILSSPDQKRATLNLTLKFLELDSKERSQTLVHELMHCHLFSLHYLTEKSIEQACSKKVSEMFLVGFDCEIEKATDAIADIIAPFVPKFNLPI